MSSKFCKQVFSDSHLETNWLNESVYVRILVESFDGQLWVVPSEVTRTDPVFYLGAGRLAVALARHRRVRVQGLR